MNRITHPADLDGFSGSACLYRHWMGRMKYTTGVRFLAGNAGSGSYWLLDLIASYQPRLERFQVWEIKCTGDGALRKAWISMREDKNAPYLIEQLVEHTDFPIDINLWLIDGVLMLPSEY